MNPDDPERRPEDYLEVAKSGVRSPRGSLRVYLGMCPGVGKTFAMLEDARRLRSEGASLLVGVVETHGRADTEAVMAGLPVLARKLLTHRGTELPEFDLDEALRLRPELVLVDELAHTNAPTSRHPKRWQDVQELLDAGINVWTTLNIQHVESLRDAVMRITGIRVHETVPDTFLENAAEIRVVDITPEQLRARLESGKVYLGERAGVAADHFFREGNLRALREMALRFTTQKVDAEKREFMRRNLIPGPWRTSERFLVAVGPSPHSGRLVRIACRLAQAQDAGWLGVYVDSGEVLSVEAGGRLAENLALVRALGGEVISLPAEDTAAALLEVARRENITQIIAGKALHLSWWSRLSGTGISERLQRDSGDIDILLVHPGETTVQEQKAVTAGKNYSRAREWGLVLGALAGVSLIGLLLEGFIGYRSVALLYLLCAAMAGLVISRIAVIVLAIAGSIAWNFLFTQPRLSFNMLNAEDVVLLFTSLVVAIVIGHLTNRLRHRELASRKAEERARALYQLTRVTSASISLEQGVRSALAQVEQVFSAQATLLGLSNSGNLEILGGPPMDKKEESVCQWALEHSQPAGRFTDTLPQAAIMALPLSVNGQITSVLAVKPTNDQLASPLLRDLLETFAAHFSVMLEKEEYQRSSRESVLRERAGEFQSALLDHVSHEIKTPVAVIQGASDHLLATNLPPAARPLVEELRQAAKRLNRVLTQLVALTRAEAGLIEARIEVCDAFDLMREVAENAGSDRVVVEECDLTFRTDAAIFETIFSNLLQNALQHGSGPVHVAANEENNQIRFLVTNQGPPIPEADQAVIFERFQRGKNSRAGGMGLGLPIAKKFAALLEGEVLLSSSDSRETRFELRLPQH